MRFLSWECQEFEYDTSTSEDSPECLRTSKDIKILNGNGNSPDISASPSLRTCIAKRDLAPSVFYLKKEISSFTHSFHFLHQFECT